MLGDGNGIWKLRIFTGGRNDRKYVEYKSGCYAPPWRTLSFRGEKVFFLCGIFPVKKQNIILDVVSFLSFMN